jgi:hypothetical protein
MLDDPWHHLMVSRNLKKRSGEVTRSPNVDDSEGSNANDSLVAQVGLDFKLSYF